MSRPGPPEADQPRPKVLVATDDPDDAEVARRSLEDLGARVLVASSSAEALTSLEAGADGGSATGVRLVLVALSQDGHGLLATIKGDPALRRVPVILITRGETPEETTRAYDLQANAHVIRPGPFSDEPDLFRAISDFWLHSVVVPHD